MTNNTGEKKRITSLILSCLLVCALIFSLAAMAGCGNTNAPKADPPKENDKDKDKDKADGKDKEDSKDKDDGKDKEDSKDKEKPKTQEDIDNMQKLADARAQKLLDDGVATSITEISIFPANAPDGYEIEYVSAKTLKPDFYVFQG